MKEPYVCILILNWNGMPIIKNCLNSLFKITNYKNFKVIVIDNDSTDASVKFIENKFKNVDILKNENNLGFIKGNNIGIKYALRKYNPKYIVLLNNDTEIIQKNWLKKMVYTAESDRKIGLIGCKLVFPDGRTQWAGRKIKPNIFYLIFQTISASLNPGVGTNTEESSFVGYANTVSGACMMINKELIGEIGLLSEKLVPAFQEDVEYSFRAWKYGWKVVYVGTSSIIHLQSYSFRKREISNEKLYLALRNSVIITRKYFGFWKTLFIGMPIILSAVFFERKDKTKKLSLNNIKLRDNFSYSLFLLLYLIKTILI